jgi:hypothetical protein
LDLDRSVSCDGRTNKDEWTRPAKNICRNHRCNRGHVKGYSIVGFKGIANGRNMIWELINP